MTPSNSRWLRRLGIALAIGAAFVIGLSLRGGSSPSPDPNVAKAEATIWTCSMHPQIQLPNPGPCPICGMDLIPMETSASDNGAPRALTLSPAAQLLAEIETAPVIRKAVTTTLRMVGKLEADETAVREIAAWVPGRIDRMYIDYTGVRVEKGQKLFDLYSPELYSAQEELLQAVRSAETLKKSPLESMRRSAIRTVDASRERLRLLGMSPTQIAELEGESKPNEHVTIVSPMSGVVLHKDAVAGSYVDTGTHVYGIADLSLLWLKLDVYEADLAWIKLNQTVAFETDVYPGETFSGTVAFIDPVLDVRTRSVKVRVNVNNRHQRLKPGTFARASLSVEVFDLDGGLPLVIPATSPLVTGTRAVVYVLDPESPGRYHGREIGLGPRAGEYYVVRDGLMEGERVVSHGSFKIDSALQIQAKPSMMSPSGGAPPPGHDHGSPVTGSTSSGSSSPSTPVAPIADVPMTFHKQIDGLLAVYFDVSHGLSRDDLDKTRASARALLEALPRIDHSLLPPDGHPIWGRAVKELQTRAEQMVSAPDLASARQEFHPLSVAMTDVVRAFQTSGETPVLLYHCPMAMGGEGADWLQNTGGTENPYYGSQMFKCGSQTEVLVAGPQDPGHDHR